MRDSKPKESHRPFVAIVLAVVALGIGTQLIDRSRERDRLLLEHTKLGIERDRMERELALQELRYEDSQAERVRAREQQRFSNEQYRRTSERAEFERWSNQVEAQVRQTERENRAFAARAAFAQRYVEVLERQQDQRDRQIARAEVERQNQWVRQREYEEERARHDRYYRLQAEESQKRYERSRDEYLRLRAHGM